MMANDEREIALPKKKIPHSCMFYGATSHHTRIELNQTNTEKKNPNNNKKKKRIVAATIRIFNLWQTPGKMIKMSNLETTRKIPSTN